jgi:hypothetical protein
VSTWPNGGVPPTMVAESAGHSVEVLLRIYAKCLDRGDTALGQPVKDSGPKRPHATKAAMAR